MPLTSRSFPRPFASVLAAGVTTALTVSLLAWDGSPAAAQAPVAASSSVAAAADDSGAARDLVDPTAQPGFERGLGRTVAKNRKKFFPARGVTFNNPIGPKPKQYAIYNKILRTINSAPKGSTIKIMSWNIYAQGAVTALLNADKRGVKLRILMDRKNVDKIPNPSWKRLKNQLRKQNRGVKWKNRSVAKTCVGSCRGKKGEAHAKFFMFSKSGSARKVVIQGSVNLTAAAAINQWNDIYTWVGNKNIYKFAGQIFGEMWKDRPVKRTFKRVDTPNGSLMFSPYGGQKFPGDPMQKLLNDTRCKGARKGAGTRDGRTIVRVAPDVMRHKRGLRAAARLKQMWDRGCDVKIAYTVLSVKAFKLLKSGGPRGPIPLKHLVQDFDQDGDFDNYFHMKSFTINGRVKGDRRAHYVVNGSSNMSGVASTSDENIGIYDNKKLMKRYQKHITFWFNNAPRKSRESEQAALRSGIDPYRTMDMD